MAFENIRKELNSSGISLVAVSKTKPVKEILKLYDFGQRHFGENRAKELAEKYETLPTDIKWHMIGHLQKNKVKYIAPFVHLIHSVDDAGLLDVINKEGKRNSRVIDVLLQLKIASEESKFGFEEQELMQIIENDRYLNAENVRFRGIMAMASFVNEESQIRSEFSKAKTLFDHIQAMNISKHSDFNILSMGMSGDYKIAIECGSTMVRIGSLIFGERN
jgi:pyridoxal phosphate enzyme (YggS family)